MKGLGKKCINVSYQAQPLIPLHTGGAVQLSWKGQCSIPQRDFPVMPIGSR